MKEKNSMRKLNNFFLILILLLDLMMLSMWVLSSLGISPIPNYPPVLQLLGLLMVLIAVSFSLFQNNMKSH